MFRKMLLLAVVLTMLVEPIYAQEEPQPEDDEPRGDIIIMEERSEVDMGNEAQKKLGKQLDEIKREIDRRRANGDVKSADELQRDLEKFRSLESGTYECPKSDKTQLCIVSIYEGGQKGVEPEKCNVTVQNTGSPVVLLLHAYSKLNWHVTIEPGAQVKKIIQSGYEPSKIWGVPDSVPVETMEYLSTNGDFTTDLSVFSKCHDAEILKTTGLKLSTFQSAYTGKDFIVGPGDKEWRAQHLIQLMAPVYAEAQKVEKQKTAQELSKLRFTAAMQKLGEDESHDPFGGKCYLADCTPMSATLRKSKFSIPMGIQGIVDYPAGKCLYAIDNHELYRLSTDKEGQECIKPSHEVPSMSWLSGITYDTKRNRILIVNMSFIHGYSPETGKWSCLSRLSRGDNWMVSGLAYMPEDDRIYALSKNPSTETLQSLIQFDGDGHVVKRIPLADQLRVRSGHSPNGVQLFASGGKLVLMDGPAVYGGVSKNPPVGFVIDPTNGSIVGGELAINVKE